MKFFWLFMLMPCCVNAQDTVFHKVTKEYESTVTRHKYDLVAMAKYMEKTDTVFVYEYGAYMSARVKDIVISDNYHICLYGVADSDGYSIYEYKNNKWSPLMGGILRFYNNTSVRTEVSIIGKNKIQVKEAEKSTIYKLDFVRKTIEVYDDK